MYILGLLILFNGLSIISSYGGDLKETLNSGIENNTETFLMPDPLDEKPKVTKNFWGPLAISPVPKVTFKTDRLENYAKHLTNRGVEIINHSATKMVKQNDIKMKNLLSIYPITKDYIKKIQDFLSHLKENYGIESGHPVGEEFLILNMLEKACEIVYQQQWLLINKTEMKPTKEFIDKIEKNSKTINKQIKNWRKEEMQYICSMFAICKPYPSFSNRVEQLIAELLKLPDNKLKVFLDTLKKKVVGNKDFLALVGGVKGKDKLFQRIKYLHHKRSLKESLTSIRVVISSRNKISNSNIRTQATKVLLDIIDKAFLFNRDKNIVLNFENFNKVVIGWRNNKWQLDEILLEQLINAILKTINSIENPVKSTLIRTITLNN